MVAPIIARAAISAAKLAVKKLPKKLSSKDSLDKIIRRLSPSKRKKPYPSNRLIKKRRRDRGDPEGIGYPNEGDLGLRALQKRSGRYPK